MNRFAGMAPDKKTTREAWSGHNQNELAADDLIGGDDLTDHKLLEEAGWSESLLRAVVEGIPDPVFAKDRQGRRILINPAAQLVVGRCAAELIGKDDLDIYPNGEVGVAMRETDKRIMDTGRAEVVEETLDTASGRRIFLSTKTPWRDSAGKVIGLIGLAHDITERKRLEEELARYRAGLETLVREQTQQLVDKNRELTAIIESIGDPFYILDRQWRLVYINKAAARAAIRLNETHVGQNIWEVIPELIGKEFYQKLHEAVATKQPLHFVAKGLWQRWFSLDLYPYINGLLVYSRDITESRAADDKIKDQAKLLDLAHDNVVRTDLDDRIIYWNRGAELGYGWSKDEALGQVVYDLLQTEYPEPLEQVLSTVRSTGHWEGDLSQRRKDGGRIIVRCHLTLIEDEVGDSISILGIGHDITAQKRSEELFYKAFHTNPSMLAIISLPSWRYLDVNASLAEAVSLSRSRIIGLSSEELGLWVDDAERQSARTALLRQGRFRNKEIKYNAKHGEWRIGLLSADRITLGDKQCALLVLIDITEQKRYEAEMARLDCLSIIGEMAAGIGHEIRNPLTTIRGYLQLFQRNKHYAEHQRQFQTMIEELDRANSIITEFLSLAKNKTVELRPGNLNNVLRILFPLLQADAFQAGHTLRLEAGDSGDILLDEKELRQLILNLVRNGFEAMTGGGALTIKSYPEDGQVVLAVHDTGPGIPAEVLDRLGTPFLTTKENGTGLGLAVCYRIAERHRAKIEIKSSPAGTRFLVKFPVVNQTETVVKTPEGIRSGAGTEK